MTGRAERWRDHWGLGLCLALALGLAALNLPFGIAGDLDGHLVAVNAAAWQTQGLVPSRSWGFPAYEAVVYPLVSHLGTLAGKLYSLAYELGAIALFYRLAVRLARHTGAPHSVASGATLALVAVPIVIISGNTLLETSQGLFWALAALALFDRCLERPTRCRLLLLALALGLATATRPDYVLLAGALAPVLLRYARPSWRDALAAATLYLLCGLAPYVVYREAIRTATVVLADPLAQRALRAAVGVVQLLGPPAWAVLVTEVIGHWRRGGRPALGPWELLLAVAAVLYGIRFLLLPDELEYLIVLAPLLLLVLVRQGWRGRSLATLAAALAIANMVQFHVLAADADGQRHLSPGFSPGAIWQDRTARLRWQYVYEELPTQFAQVAARYGVADYVTMPSEQPGALVIIPQDQTRFYATPRHGGRFWRVRCEQTIIVYPMTSDRAWRQLTRYTPWQPITLTDYCRYSPPGCAVDD